MKIIVNSTVYESQQAVLLREMLRSCLWRLKAEPLSKKAKKDLACDLVSIAARLLDGTSIWHHKELSDLPIDWEPLQFQPLLMFAQDEDKREIIFSEEEVPLSDRLDELLPELLADLKG